MHPVSQMEKAVPEKKKWRRPLAKENARRDKKTDISDNDDKNP